MTSSTSFSYTQEDVCRNTFEAVVRFELPHAHSSRGWSIPRKRAPLRSRRAHLARACVCSTHHPHMTPSLCGQRPPAPCPMSDVMRREHCLWYFIDIGNSTLSLYHFVLRSVEQLVLFPIRNRSQRFSQRQCMTHHMSSREGRPLARFQPPLNRSGELDSEGRTK